MLKRDCLVCYKLGRLGRNIVALANLVGDRRQKLDAQGIRCSAMRIGKYQEGIGQ